MHLRLRRGFGLILIGAALLALPAAVRAQAKDGDLEKFKADVEAKLKELKITLNQLEATSDRYRKEVESLSKSIKDREKMILEFEADMKRYRNEAIVRELDVKRLEIQNEILRSENERLRKILEKAKISHKDDSAAPDAKPNPPKEKVNGKVEKLDGDLVLINLGTDNGIAKGNTLDVYRTQPKPKYLGMVRIVDANHNQSVARRMPLPDGTKASLIAGDLVTSDLSNERKEKAEKDKKSESK